MTMLEKLKELYPNAAKGNDGFPERCPDEYPGLDADCGSALCFAPGQCEWCWSREWKGGEKNDAEREGSAGAS